MGEYIDKGNSLLGYGKKNEWEKWASEIEEYLAANLSGDYVSRFRRLAPSTDEPQECEYPTDAFLRVRILRLDKFIKELCLEEAQNAKA